MTRAVLLCAAIVLAGCAGTPTGDKLDDQCIPGRLKSESAAWLNEHPESWKQHSDFTAPLESGDRLLSRDCSEALIALAAGDFEALDAALKRMKQNDD